MSAPTPTRAGWLRAGVAVAAVSWGSNQFAPLLLVYRASLHLSEAVVQATFFTYALGLVPGLLVLGPLADRFGRRRVMVPALVASLAATALLVVGGSSVGLLFVGRFVAGVASAGAYSSGAAWVKELSTQGDAAVDEGVSARRVTVTMTTGFAGGPLLAGLLAGWAPWPTVTPYAPHLVLLVASLLLMVGAPETLPQVDHTRLADRLRMPELRTPRFRTVALPLAPWVFGGASVALAYLPGLVEHRLGDRALTYTAVVTMLTALSGILVQPLARRVGDAGATRLVGVAFGLTTAGLLVASYAAGSASPVAVVVAAVVLGTGYGCCHVAGMREVQRLARPQTLAALTGIYQAASYTGFVTPFALAAAGALAAPWVLVLVVAALAALTMRWVVSHARTTDEEPEHA